MKNITIEEIRLLNFKGIRELTVSFGNKTTVSGWNGTGKTSIADAIYWLLFDKDSKNREKFDIKTLDENGRIIYNLPHEVNGIIRVNGEEIKLTKRIIEKWKKNSDFSNMKDFKGNEIERLFNDIPCSETEYKAKISEICKEEDFRYITNPYYFSSRDSKVQKSKLLEMAGIIKDAEIANGNKDFEELLRILMGKVLKNIRRKYQIKKTRISNKLSGIPDRIDEKKRDLPESRDWDVYEKDLQEKEDALKEIEDQIMDIVKWNETQDNSIHEIYDQINSIRESISKRETEIYNEANKGFFSLQERWNDLHQQAISLKTDINSFDRVIEDGNSEIKSLSEQRDKLIEEWKSLSNQEKEIRNRHLVFEEDQFKCPLCHRQLEMDDIEVKQTEIRNNFENQRKSDLEAIAKKKEINMKKGATCSKALIQERTDYLKGIQLKKDECRKKMESIMEMPDYINEPEKIDARPMIEADAMIQEYNSRIEGLQKKISMAAKKRDFTELEMKRSSLKAGINAVKSTLVYKDIFNRDSARIKELEDQYSKLSGSLNELDHIEYVIDAFSKAKNREVARRIDNLFR